MFSHDIITDVAYPTGSNYLMALGDVATAVTILRNSENYSKQATVTASLSLLSATELFLVSSLPLIKPVLGPLSPFIAGAYAGKLLIDSIKLSIEVHQAAKKVEFEGWLEESFIQLKRYNEVIAKHKHLKTTYTAERATIYSTKDRAKLTKKIDAATTTLRDAEKKYQNLSADIESRCIVYRDAAGDVAFNKPDQATPRQLISDIAEKNNADHRILRKLESKVFSSEAKPTTEDRQRDAKIQIECEKQLKQKSIALSLTILNFIGYGLLAASLFYPPLFIPALIIVGTVGVLNSFTATKSIMKTAKHGPKLVGGNQNAFFRLNTTNNPTQQHYLHASIAAKM